MNVTELKIIREDERGAMYDCDKLKFIARKQGTVSVDHSHADEEILYLLRGEIELTVAAETRTISALAKIEISSDTYHKLIALSDIEILEDREGA